MGFSALAEGRRLRSRKASPLDSNTQLVHRQGRRGLRPARRVGHGIALALLPGAVSHLYLLFRSTEQLKPASELHASFRLLAACVAVHFNGEPSFEP